MKSTDQNGQDGAQWQEEKLSVSELKKSQDIDKMLVQVDTHVEYFSSSQTPCNACRTNLHCSSKLLTIFFVQVENLFINQLEAGNRKKAMARFFSSDIVAIVLFSFIKPTLFFALFPFF